MALFVDFVGLNTLIEEPVDVNTNTVGNFSESRASGSTLLNAGRGNGLPMDAGGTLAPFAGYPLFPDGEVRNTAIKTINGADYLVALNNHRNGPYGYPIFKQLRAGQSPIIRRQRLTNIFSHYEYPGQTLTFENGRNTRNFTLINFKKIPTASQTNDTLDIVLGGTTFTVEFNTIHMDTYFGDSGVATKLRISVIHSSLMNMNSDHDRIQAIAERIATAVRRLEEVGTVSGLGRVVVSSSPFLYSQAKIFIEAKAYGPTALSLSSTYTHHAARTQATIAYQGAMQAGQSLTFHHPKGDYVINFVSGNDTNGDPYVTDTTFSATTLSANIQIDTENDRTKTAAAVATLLDSLPAYSATTSGGSNEYATVVADLADEKWNFTLSEVETGFNMQILPFILQGASQQDEMCLTRDYQGTSETISRVVPQRRQSVEHYNEVPVVSRHRPLRLVGSVTTTDPNTNTDTSERVEVYTTLGNETAHFSNAKLNKFYGTEGLLGHDYENFADLYLEGGIDGDESPIDEFRYMMYKQVVYPKEIYTYKNHTRNRINFVSRYWRDDRADRTNRTVDNGFGFTVMSQSAWVLDGEQNFKDLTFVINPGTLTVAHPNRQINHVLAASSSFETLSSSTETFTFPGSGIAAQQRSISMVNLGDAAVGGHPTNKRYSPIHGVGGYPFPQGSTFTGARHGTHGIKKTAVAVNPWDVSVSQLESYAGLESIGLRGLFEYRGFNVGSTLRKKHVRWMYKDNRDNYGWRVDLSAHGTAAQEAWRTKTTASTLSTWIAPSFDGSPASHLTMNEAGSLRSFLSGTLYHEKLLVENDDGSTKTVISKMINFDPITKGVKVRLGTVFTSSADGTLKYFGANEAGAVQYDTRAFYGADNPIYLSAIAWNEDLQAGADGAPATAGLRVTANHIAASSINHLLAEINLSGSRPDLALAHSLSAANRKKRGAHFRARHAHNNTDANTLKDPNGYARIYVNSQASTVYEDDPYGFLQGSQGNFQQQLVDGNSSLKLDNITSNRDTYNLSCTDFASLNPFSSKGFSFSYWINFGEDPETTLSGDDNLVFTIRDGSNVPIIDHTIGGANKYLQVGFQTSNGTKRVWRAEKSTGYTPNVWYNITFSVVQDGANMVGSVQIYKEGQSSPRPIASSGWLSDDGTAARDGYGTLTAGEWVTMNSSTELYVLAAGSSFPLIRAVSTNAPTDLDNIKIDQLVFFNGGLTTWQKNTLVSGSTNTDESGLAGDAPPAISTTLYPATDTTTALKSLGSSPVMRHARRNYQLNTHYTTEDGILTGRLRQRNEGYKPFGGYSSADFQSGIIDRNVDGAVAGEFSTSFWFKPTHENFRIRSILNEATSGPGVTEGYTRFNSNIGRRLGMENGFFISFWYRRGKPFLGNTYSGTNHTHILKCENNKWGISVLADKTTSPLSSNTNRRLALWFIGDTDEGNSTAGQMIYTATSHMPEDGEWHFVSVQWNGKTGPECHVCFEVDNGGKEICWKPTVTDTGYAPKNVEDLPILNTGAGDYKVGVDVLMSPTTMNLGNTNGRNDVGNICHLNVITNCPDPWIMQTYRDMIYNNGQFFDTYYNMATYFNGSHGILTKNYGTATIRNPIGGGNAKMDAVTNTWLNHNDLSAYTFQRYDPLDRMSYFEVTDGNTGNWAPESFNQAGGYTISFFFESQAGTASEWRDASMWWLCDLRSSDNDRIMQLYSPQNSNDLIGFGQAWNGSDHVVKFKFDNVVPYLCNGQTHDVIFTWCGETDGSGVPRDCRLYIDGIPWTTDHSYSAGTAGSRSVSTMHTAAQLTIGTLPGTDSNRETYMMPYSYTIGAVKLFRQFMGGATTNAAQQAIRASLRYRDSGASSWTRTPSGDSIYDPAWNFKANYTLQTVDFPGGSRSSATNVNYKPPVVDCLISPNNLDIPTSHYSSQVKQVINRASHDAKLDHYYELGKEPELRTTPLFDHIRKAVVPNHSFSVSRGAPSPLSCSAKLRMDTGPRHWEAEWFSYDGDVNSDGEEASRNSFQQENQQLLYIGDNDNNSIPRSVFQGIELYLSASGGGYSLESVLPRQTTSSRHRSKDNIIIPNRWHHLHVNYSGLTNSTTPTANVYLNGQAITMDVISAGAGNYRPCVGTDPVTVGVGGEYYTRPFAGYFQDICFWNKSMQSDLQHLKCKNVIKGIGAGSDYINTSATTLAGAFKCGYLEGQSTHKIAKVAGSVTPAAGSNHWGMTSTDRAKITGPPKHLYRTDGGSTLVDDDNGGTIISWWSSLATTDDWHDIIAFQGDGNFQENEYETYGDIDVHVAGTLIKPLMFQSTDTSGIPTEDSHTNFRISLKHKEDGGQYVLRVTAAGVMDHNSGLSAERGDALNLTSYEITSPFVSDSGQLIHNVVMIMEDQVNWYINGNLQIENSFTFGQMNESAMPHDYDIGVPGSYIPFFRNGWNNIKVLDEVNPYANNSVIDEVAVLFYDDLRSQSDSDRLATAVSMYNGGAVYNFAIRNANLYGWWRMGENLQSTPINVGSNVGNDDQIDDESGRGNHLNSVFGARLQAVVRASDGATDLRNHWTFNGWDPSNNSLVKPGAAGNQFDNISSKWLAPNGSSGTKWLHDYSYDSYELWPLNWLACEGLPNRAYFTGEKVAGLAGRLTYNSLVIGGAEDSDRDRAMLSDIAIYSGVSTHYNGTAHVENDQTKGKLEIKFNSNVVSGETLILIANPRGIPGGGAQGSGDTRELRIEFTLAGGVDTTFTGPPTFVQAGHPNTHKANINVGAGMTPADVIDALENLIDDASGFTGTPAKWTYSQPTADTLVLTDYNAGGDGKWEIIGKWIGEAGKCSISTAIGYSHISKALTRRPGFGWVQQNDSDFSRVDNNHTIAGSGLIGESNSSSRVKPYWYILETKNDETKVGSQYTNIGVSSATGFHIQDGWKQNNAKDDLGDGWTGKFGRLAIDSGSAIGLKLDNTPALDFNDIEIHTASYMRTDAYSHLPAFDSPDAPQSLVGGYTGARARFGPGILQNSYNQFAQVIRQGSGQTIDTQLSASACYFRRHSLTASTSFVAPQSGFLQKLSASHNLSSARTALCGNMSASHLFLGSAKWEAGDFAGYYNDAGTFVFKPKKPFYDNYDAFIEEARPIMKDYGIMPEFKISEHVNSYMVKGVTEQKLDFLNITGGLASADVSNKDNFYEIYSTSDFLKHFDVVQEDHSDFVDPFAVRLRCSVVKKFLPYEGFYPAQRTVQVAQQFYKSYGDNINVTASTPAQYDLSKEKNYGIQYLLNPLFSPGILFNTIKSGVAVDYPLITDTGSVKRVLYTDGSEVVNGGAMITEQFDTRVPFEALIEPEKHLANITLASNEPDPNGRTEIEVKWGGQGDQLYNLMVSNFLAETSEFFLENKSFTSLASLSQGDPNFGNAQAGNAYMMRLKMFRTTSGQKPPGRNALSKSYGLPQDTAGMREEFTMYSRPSAFGPPQWLSGSDYTALTWSDYKFDGSSGSLYIEDQSSPYGDLKALPFQHDFSYVTGATYGSPYGDGSGAGGILGNQAELGYNYSFTPPYYHGEAWADITFIPTETKKYTLQEIINQSSVEFYRYFAGSGSIGGVLSAGDHSDVGPVAGNYSTYIGKSVNSGDGYTIEGDPAMRIHLDGGRSTLSHVHDRTVLINDQAMQLASSVNIFSQGVLEQDIVTLNASGIKNVTNVSVDTDVTNKYRWIIQTKFETPMLNFNHYTYGKHTNELNRNGYSADPDGTNHHGGLNIMPKYEDNTYGIQLPGVGPMQTPIGMWHQYGHIPQNSKEGVFLQVDDVPKSWIANAMNKTKAETTRYRSLASLCGFSTDPVRLGEVAGVKEISEAVVAIPFFERDGRRRFFSMKPHQIDFALDPSKTNLVGRTVVDMVEKMKKFVIPPSLDFVNNRKIKPFSMYIFEFTHNLTKQDLADIWQNLPPDLNETVQTDEVSISHQLLAYELLGRGGQYRKGRDTDIELVRNDRMTSLNPEIQWMVFKVKQRAKSNYFEKIFARNESKQLLSERLKMGVSADALGRRNKISYNWPYDFFSMIEGVKLSAEVLFLDIDEEETLRQEKPVVKPKVKEKGKTREEKKSTAKRALGAVSGIVTPDELKKAAIKKAEKVEKKRRGKITRKRRLKRVINKPATEKKKPGNVFDRKKLK